MGQAHKPDYDTAAADCRFIVRSEAEAEAIELAKRHVREVHGHNYADEELRSKHLQLV